MLAGLSGVYILRMPPCFWADAGLATDIAANNALAAMTARIFSIISLASLLHLSLRAQRSNLGDLARIMREGWRA